MSKKNIEGVLRIDTFQQGMEVEISKLIKRVYDEFVANDYTEEGNRFFYDWIQPEKIAQRQKENRNIIVATTDSQIVGMIETRDDNRISLLFVDKEFHGMGIARILFNESLEECKKKDSSLDKFYVHASPFSIPIYKKLGFVEIGPMQEEHGIKYLPMELDLSHLNMIYQLIEMLKSDPETWSKYCDSFVETQVPSDTVLLRQGEIARHIYLVKKGCLRLWLNENDKDLTLHFFFENDPIASMISFLNNEPSQFTIDTIEPTTLIAISKDTYDKLVEIYPSFISQLDIHLLRKLNYFSLLRLKQVHDSPMERYNELVKDYPKIFKRVPLQHIASFLEITPDSLSQLLKEK